MLETLKKIEYETESGRVVIETWKSSLDKVYTTVETFGCVDLTIVEEAIKLFKKENPYAESRI